MRAQSGSWTLIAFLLAIYPLSMAARLPRAADIREAAAVPRLAPRIISEPTAMVKLPLLRRQTTSDTASNDTAAQTKASVTISVSSTASSSSSSSSAAATSSAASVEPSVDYITLSAPSPTGNTQGGAQGPPVTTITSLTVLVPPKSSGGLSTPIIIVIAGCGGLALFLIICGCCIARRRKSKKNDWLSKLLESESEAPSSPRSAAAPSKESEGAASPPKAPLPQQPTVSHLPMMSLPQFFPMFSGMQGQQQIPPPQPSPYMSQAPQPSIRQPSMSQSRGRSVKAGSNYVYDRPRSPEVPHHPGLPSVEPHIYDDGSPSTAVSQNEKNRWLRRARQGLTSSQVPDLLPPDRPPSPDHTVWDGPAGSEAGSDALTSISRRHLKKMQREAAKRGGWVAPGSAASSQQRTKSRGDKISLSDSDLGRVPSSSGRQSLSRHTNSRGGYEAASRDYEPSSRGYEPSSRAYEMGSRNRGGGQPATAFSLSPSDLNPTSSYRGVSNDGAPRSALPGDSMASALKPRHRRIDSLIRSDVNSKRSR